MGDMKPTAWTVKAPGWGSPPFHIQNWRAYATRAEVHKVVGIVWAKKGETARQGWRRAHRKGWRAVRCAVVEV